MARPRKEIDEEQFEKLCALQCTLAEIASWFKCSEDTIERWCMRNYEMGFAEAYKNYSVDGKISLRRIQFKQAEKHPNMAIWLGKQWLGQRDVVEAQIPQAQSAIEQIAKLVLNTPKDEPETDQEAE